MSTCDHHELKLNHQTSSRSPTNNNTVTGFYYNGQWISFVLKNKHFSVSEMRECLQNQTVHVWGDSTIRQWFWCLVGGLDSHLAIRRGINDLVGPHVATDKEYNIRLEFRHHGQPVHRDLWTSPEVLQYVPNMMDQIEGGSNNDVILLTLWAHFQTSSVRYYTERWRVVKDAILRLKARNPGVRVIIKTANTGLSSEAEWYVRELDQAMRHVMADKIEGVTILDVMDMTMGHRTGFVVHPAKDVVLQEIDMVLSILCP